MKNSKSVTNKVKNYGFVALVVFLFATWTIAGLLNIRNSEREYSILAWKEITSELEAKILWKEAKELGITIVQDESGDYGLSD